MKNLGLDLNGKEDIFYGKQEVGMGSKVKQRDQLEIRYIDEVKIY